MNVSQPQSTLAGWTPAARSKKSHYEFLHTAPSLSCCALADKIAGAWGVAKSGLEPPLRHTRPAPMDGKA